MPGFPPFPLEIEVIHGQPLIDFQFLRQTYGQTPKRLFDKPHPMINQKFVVASFQNQQNPSHLAGGRTVPKVVDSVEGLQWGTYIGSPSESEPIVIWKAKQVRKINIRTEIELSQVLGWGKMQLQIGFA